MSEGLLTVEQVAAWAQVRVETVRQEIAECRLRAAKIGNGWKIQPADRDAWFDSLVPTCAPKPTPINSRRGPSTQTYALGKVAS